MAGSFSLTSLIRLQLGLQVLRGHVKILFLALWRPRFTLSAAAVTTATQATAEVAASGQAAEYKQRLQWHGGDTHRWRDEERVSER